MTSFVYMYKVANVTLSVSFRNYATNSKFFPCFS